MKISDDEIMLLPAILLATIVLSRAADPDEFRDVPELISSKGYAAETHNVQTDDGYILQVHRIPCPKGQKSCASRQPVMLQHGLLASSASWVLNNENESLAFILADAGYDVWMGNMRGNLYALKHVWLTPADKKFWDFTFDDMAQHDLTSMIDYILATTKQQQLTYVGHSQGTMIGFVQFSRDSETAAKVKHFHALAPVAHVGNIEGPLREVTPLFERIWKNHGNSEFMVENTTKENMELKFCGSNIGTPLCENLYFMLYGFDYKRMNATRLPVYLAHMPAGTSLKNIVHFAQLIQSKAFRRFDYGRIGNFLRYLQPEPPNYIVSRMTVPVTAYHAFNDWLADPVDVNVYLLPHLTSLADQTRLPTYNHIDFVLAITANEQVYPKILEQLRQ